jgi:ribosomal protein S11
MSQFPEDGRETWITVMGANANAAVSRKSGNGGALKAAKKRSYAATRCAAMI